MTISECPQCGAAAQPSQRRCEYCKAEFFITNLAYLGNLDKSQVAKYLKHYNEIIKNDPNDNDGLLGLGLCYLQMGTFQLAEKCFLKIIESSPEISQAYYYYGISSIKGRRIKILSLTEIRKIETYLLTAIQIDDGTPQYKLLLAMIKKDYYEANGLRILPPSTSDLLSEIQGIPIDVIEIERLEACVKITDFDFFKKNIALASF
jgi:tetratricopeptide (TPR) repeat protein